MAARIVIALAGLPASVSGHAQTSPQPSSDTAAPADMQEPDAVTTTGFPEETQFVTAFPHVWTIGSTQLQITVPDGFVTDFASIPADLQYFLKTQGTYSRAAVIHDFLYWSQACTRLQSDNLLLIAMIESRVPWAQRTAIYNGVRAGGQFAWNANAREKADGLGRSVPTAYRTMVNHQGWPAVRRYLADHHVKDPVMTVDQRVCAIGNHTVVP